MCKLVMYFGSRITSVSKYKILECKNYLLGYKINVLLMSNFLRMGEFMKKKDLKLEEYRFTKVNKSDKKVFIALSANYGNIGDIAITIAQQSMIKQVFSDRKIVEIPMDDAFDYEEEIKKILNDDDILTIIGGGNLGNAYLWFEERRRFIIKLFKNNKSISFPQSVSFDEDEIGQKELEISVEDYAQNPNLIVFAREKKSYDIMKANFKNKVYLVPDIVLSLKDRISKETGNIRTNITLCLRSDMEKTTSENIVDDLRNLLNANAFENIVITDTHLGHDLVKISERRKIFETSLQEFKNSKVVITDRLHGMIFCIITNTPCIALDNSNHKILSTYYTWLKDVPLVKFLEDYDEDKILGYVKELSSIENPKIDFNFDKHFEELVNALKE